MDFKLSMTSRLICNLGDNKMEQQTPIPPNQGRSRAKGKYVQFSHLWFYGERMVGVGLGFPFILSNFAILDRIKWNRKTHPLYPPPPTPKARMKRGEGQKRTIFPSLILGGGSRVSIYFVQECGSRLERVKVVFGLGQIWPVISQLQAI